MASARRFAARTPSQRMCTRRVAPYLLGKDPLQIERHSRHLLNPYVGFNSSSAEIRAASAVDIALWDVWGQATRQPIYQLLGEVSAGSRSASITPARVTTTTIARAKQRVVQSGADYKAEGPV